MTLETTNIDAWTGVEPRDRFDKARSQTPFGSLIVFTVMLNRDADTRLEINYRRFDSPTLAKGLEDLLDRVWPLGSHSVGDYLVPSAP